VPGFINVIRNTLTELVGPADVAPAELPVGLPEAVLPAARVGVALLTDYQSPAYAQLYCDRLRRFIGRRGVDDALFAEIARLLAARMAYHDAIRIAQLKLQEPPGQGRAAVDVRRFRCDELLGALPVIAGGPLLRAFEIIGCTPHQLLLLKRIGTVRCAQPMISKARSSGPPAITGRAPSNSSQRKRRTSTAARPWPGGSCSLSCAMRIAS
jgi:hypothetical protein